MNIRRVLRPTSVLAIVAIASTVATDVFAQVKFNFSQAPSRARAQTGNRAPSRMQSRPAAPSTPRPNFGINNSFNFQVRPQTPSIQTAPPTRRPTTPPKRPNIFGEIIRPLTPPTPPRPPRHPTPPSQPFPPLIVNPGKVVPPRPVPPRIPPNIAIPPRVTTPGGPYFPPSIVNPIRPIGPRPGAGGIKLPPVISDGSRPKLPGNIGDLVRPSSPILPGKGVKPIGPINLGNGKPTTPKVPLNNILKLPADKPQTIPLGDKLAGGNLNKLIGGKIGKDLGLANQLKIKKDGGNLAIKLGLHKLLGSKKKLWGKHAPGLLSPHFHSACFHYHNCWGSPWYYPDCHYPTWCGWVDWCWGWDWHHHHHHCWDPRPIYCQPLIYHPCPQWTCWNSYPVWTPLPYHCGTYVDVAPIVVHEAKDLQLLAVRFVDPGHPEKQLGTRFRVFVRNNSDRAITVPFSVMLLASDATSPGADAPFAGTQVKAIQAGETRAVDVRMPIIETAVSNLHVLVDSHRDVAESNESNNGTVVAVEKVLPVDPVLFGSNEQQLSSGSAVNLAGEGLGSSPGRVVVQAAGMEWEGTIEGWSDLGIRVQLPKLPLASETPAEVLLVRGDGVAANPLSVTLLP